jgi:hypothetical protein
MRDEVIHSKLRALPKCKSVRIFKRSGVYAVRWLKKDDGTLVVVVLRIDYSQFVLIEESSDTKESIEILLKWSVIK